MAEPRYRYGGDSAIGALLLPERREILRDEQNQFIGYDDQGNAIVETIPAQYGESEVDFSYSPIVRGARSAGSFLNDIFFGDANEQSEAAGRAVSAVRGVVKAVPQMIDEQMRAAGSGGRYYDPETRRIVEFDPTIVMGGGSSGGGPALASGFRRSGNEIGDTLLYSGGGRQGSAIAGGSALHNLKMRAVNGDESAIAELMTIEGLDRDNVVRRLQNYVARYEGQSPEQRAIEYNASKPVRLGQSTEERMQRSSEQGYSGPYYTGAGRLDRLLEKDQILPERATSGPMPFFTTDTDLASSYAKNKRDTSIELTNNKDAFTVNPLDFNLPRDKQITVEDSWNYLSPDKKEEILSKVKRIGYEDLDNFEGKFVLHPEGVKGLPSSEDHFDYIMRTEAKGNPLAALRELWLDSGNLYDQEELMENIYKLSGFPARISQINAPWTEASGVLPVMMRLKNPVDTTNTDSLKQTVIPALRAAFSDPKYNVKKETLGADQWDKNTRYTPKQWVDQLAEDISNGENSYVWTSIPDEVTLQLEKLGYDSIIDVSGKSGGDIKEKVIIPFKPNQVRSINAEFDPEKIDSADLLSSKQSERQMSALRGIA